MGCGSKKPTLSQALIDDAVAAPLLAFQSDALQNGPMYQAKAIHFMALAVYFNPEIKASNGTLVRSTLLKQLRSVITGGQEPNAAGSFGGWTHNSIAQSFLLAKRTPVLWAELTTQDKERIDWLMKAMAVAGHFSLDDDNDFRSCLNHALGHWNKGWNPNMIEGYLGIVIAASLYFGPDELNKIFLSFSYDEYLAKFKEFGFSNILKVWQCYNWKPLMEDGGSLGDDPGSPATGYSVKYKVENAGPAGSYGSGAGVRNAFTYKGVPLSDPFGIFKKVADRNYSKTVIDGIPEKSWILDNSSSPYLGKQGMYLEFDGLDGEGRRSDAGYVMKDFLNSTTTGSTLKVLGYWGNGPAQKETEALMKVGCEDYIYKVSRGYHSYSHAKGHDTYEKDLVKNCGYSFCKEIWRQILVD